MEKVFLFQHFRLLSLKMRPSYWSRFRKSHCMKGRSKNCKVKGNTFRLWSKTSAPHSSLPAAVPGFFTSIKKGKIHFSFDTQPLLVRQQKVQVNEKQGHQENTQHLKFCLCLMSPMYQASSKSFNYHNTTKTGASVFNEGLVTELCLQSCRHQLAAAGLGPRFPEYWIPFTARPILFPSVLDLKKTVE